MQTVIGMFDVRAEAMSAYQALRADGYAAADLDVLTSDDPSDAPKLARLHEFVPQADADIYLEGVRQGATLITVRAEEDDIARAAAILGSFRIVNIGTKAEELHQVRSDLQLAPATGQEIFEVIEEDLEVGKAQVERGRMRIYNKITERQVEEKVGLRDETIRVQRRAVNRTVAPSADLFKERSYELTEVDEVALVNKVARVVEEVTLSKEVVEQIQTVKETLRRQDVEIEEVRNPAAFEEYNSSFRSFYTSNYASSGAEYERYAPAFRFGYKLATTEPFRSQSWAEVEPSARELWEDKNPGSWPQYENAVRYAWSTVTGK